jgi:hypothetical protein
MPNHVTTVISAPEEVIEALISHNRRKDHREDHPWMNDEQFSEHVARRQPQLDALSEAGYVDFNRLVPQPENIEKGDCSGEHPEGVVCWYEWNIQNWGTKWNAYETERRSATELKFETAWSHPVPIMEALAERFPNAIIEVKYADEDIGSNVGHYRIVKGELRPVEEFEQGSEKANEFASQLNYGCSYAEIRAEWDE